MAELALKIAEMRGRALGLADVVKELREGVEDHGLDGGDLILFRIEQFLQVELKRIEKQTQEWMVELDRSTAEQMNALKGSMKV